MENFFKLLVRVGVKFIVLLTVLGLRDRHTFCLADRTSNPVCTTPECRELGAYYTSNMKKDANPCHDFYDYVCHGWESKNPIPHHTDSWGLPQVLEFQAAKNIKKLLQSTTKSPYPDVEVAKVVYKKCLEMPRMERGPADTVKQIMKNVGNWPMRLPKNENLPKSLNTWQIDNAYLKITGESAFCEFVVIGNTDKSDRISLVIRPALSIYGMVVRKKRWVRAEGKSYEMFLHRIIDTVYPHTPAHRKDVIDVDLNNVLLFRDIFTEEVIKEEHDDFTTMTLQEFQTWYDQQTEKNSLAQINWFEQVRAIRVVEASAKLKVVVVKEYFIALARALRNTNKRVIANHIHLYFLEKNIKLTLSMKEALEHSITRESPAATGIIRYLPERWQTCIDMHNMLDTLGQMYVKEHFPKSSQQDVRALIEVAKQLQKDQITESSWLDRMSKLKAKRKIHVIEAIVGYPDWYEKYVPPAGRDEENQNPIEGNAFFNAFLNRLFLAAAYLQTPVYGKNLPYAVIYGATMSVIGHELSHGFDEEGIQYDEKGQEPLLPGPMMTKFTQNAKCFLDQYTKYKERELNKHGYFDKVDGTVTLGEDIADVMGLKLAYKGYLQKLQAERNVCPVLPGFETFSCEKLFFIAYANTQCRDSSARGHLYSLLTDVHSLSNIRVNGAVANMIEFSEAFNCTKNNRLRLENRCDLWKN